MRPAFESGSAFELLVSERAAVAVRRLRLALLGFALAGWLLAAPWFSGASWGVWLIAGLLVAGGAWHACRLDRSNRSDLSNRDDNPDRDRLAHHPGLAPLSCGRLFVDEQGLASWRPAGGHAGLVSVEHWSAGERLIWLRLTGHRAAPRIDLLLPRSAVSDEAWRRLRAWLLWLGRGANR